MGFGSYDESEQQRQSRDTSADEDAAVNLHENEYDGSISVETGDSTEALLGQLQDIKANKESDE